MLLDIRPTGTLKQIYRLELGIAKLMRELDTCTAKDEIQILKHIDLLEEKLFKINIKGE